MHHTPANIYIFTIVTLKRATFVNNHTVFFAFVFLNTTERRRIWKRTVESNLSNDNTHGVSRELEISKTSRILAVEYSRNESNIHRRACRRFKSQFINRVSWKSNFMEKSLAVISSQVFRIESFFVRKRNAKYDLNIVSGISTSYHVAVNRGKRGERAVSRKHANHWIAISQHEPRV